MKNMEIKEICSYRESLQLNFILVLFLPFLYLARWKNERKQARSLRFTNGKIKTTYKSKNIQTIVRSMESLEVFLFSPIPPFYERKIETICHGISNRQHFQ